MVALGKGIGFKEIPREVELSEIERSFYNMEPKDVRLMQDLPSEIVLFTANRLDIIKNELPYELSPNAVLLLADHIAFALERHKKQIHLKMPIYYDIQQMYPLEYKIGSYVLSRIKREFNVELPKEEIAAIAMNIVNSKVVNKNGIEADEVNSKMLEDITDIVENVCHIMIDRDSFDYARFATHLHYLFERIRKGRSIETENLKMIKAIREEYPKVTECVAVIRSYLLKEWKAELSDEEELYLILHVNRICVKEGL